MVEPSAKQKPSVHAPQDVEEVKDVPPALKVPTPQGTPAAEPADAAYAGWLKSVSRIRSDT